MYQTVFVQHRKPDFRKMFRPRFPLLENGTFRIRREKPSFSLFSGAEKDRRMHRCMERCIKGVRYRVYSSFSGDVSFRELYEKCLASRLLKLQERGCARDAAGD